MWFMEVLGKDKKRARARAKAEGRRPLLEMAAKLQQRKSWFSISSAILPWIKKTRI
jgi:hypothetical protein